MTCRLLGSGSGWRTWISDEARTAHPYTSEKWGDGHENHPSVDLVEYPYRICLLPEVREFPALARLLVAANITNDRLRTTACSPGIKIRDPARCSGFTRSAGALVHIALRADHKNTDTNNLEVLANNIVEAVDWGAAAHLSVCATIEPYKAWQGAPGFFGLAFEFHAYAKDDIGAWQKARTYAPLLAVAIERA